MYVPGAMLIVSPFFEESIAFFMFRLGVVGVSPVLRSVPFLAMYIVLLPFVGVLGVTVILTVAVLEFIVPLFTLYVKLSFPVNFS
jgi:hypothetical protein